ncbi:hypothetical protein GGR53DRAFT_318104 [Hypoxylon sp. FL1150]|nr:hypothetical protein GGR53DRAFT_318104 [Hypoxylon sp. FL1150]
MAFKLPANVLRDAASPATSPLLSFLLNFAEETSYLDAIKDVEDKVLWDIGRKALSQAALPKREGIYDLRVSNDRSIEEPPVYDESIQDQKEFMTIIDGSGLPNIPPGITVAIVGAGIAGLVAGYELKRSGFNIRIFEASSRVGGRVVTFRDPIFAPGLHAEGGAMRIPGNHFLTHAYIKNFNIDTLFDFDMKNKFIYLSGYRGGTTLTYDHFNDLLKGCDHELLELFPNLNANEKGKTCDKLFFEAVDPVVKLFQKSYTEASGDQGDKVRVAYQKITEAYDRYSLRSYLEDVAHWSPDAIKLYDLGNAHVVFENGFIESWKDSFLSSNAGGGSAKMQQLQHGMDQIPKAFISPNRNEWSLAGDITYGARVTNVVDIPSVGCAPSKIQVDWETGTGYKQSFKSDFVIFTVPYTAQRTITKSRPFSPALEQAIHDVRYVEVTKVLLQYRERWWKPIFSSQGQGVDGGMVSDLPIRYTMFPRTNDNEQFKHTNRGAIMAAYTFEQDATILGCMSPDRRVRIAAENLDRVFPSAESLQYLEAGASQAFPSDELAGGSAFCYFGPGQKTQYLETMRTPDWADPKGSENYRVFFAGEHTSYTHGWIHGAIGSALRCVQQVGDAARSRPLK